MPDLIAELLERCRTLDEQFAMAASRVWFRGQADAEWPLMPTALRDSFLDTAQEWMESHPVEGTRSIHGSLGESPMERSRAGLIVERVANERFRREAAPLLASPEILSVVYMEARHAEMPSRLLDWTTQPLIALFFASLAEPNRDGRIFILSAESRYYHIARTGSSSGGFVVDIEVPVADTHELFTSQLPWLFESRRYESPWSIPFSGNFEVSAPELGGVLPVLPTHRLSSVAAQHSCFTFHPPEFDERIPANQLLEPFEVPAADKEETLRGLRLLGINESAIWPSLGGTARAIRNSLGFQHEHPPQQGA